MIDSQFKGVTLFITALVVAFTSTQVNAFGTADDMDPSGLREAYKTLDKNHDKKLTKAEVAEDTDVAKGFAEADTNHSGVLSEKEYIDYKSKIQNKNNKRTLSDSLITTKVKTAILGEKGLKTMQISVETHEGIVILSGFVDTEAQVTHAGNVAKGVEGVKSVKNALVVKA
jgi:hyperosmotically inducible periplasmic protein